MEELIKIIEELKKIREEMKIKVSDEVIFSEACSFLRGQFASEARQGKSCKTLELNQSPATKKQIDLLYKMNVDFDAEKITKQQAMKLINKEIDKIKSKKKGNE